MTNKIDSNVRAMVLAAGIGSRLQPISEIVPKPLVQIAGKTVMDYILLLLKKHGITKVVSNTHHLASTVHEHFKDIKNKENIDIEFRYEEKLSGVAGGIRRCKDFLAGQTCCIIMGDALTDLDLSLLYQKHKEAVAKHNCLVSIAMMPVVETSQFGIIVTESMLPNASEDSSTGSRVVQFQEKPSQQEALSKWANTGIYFFEPKVLDYIPEEDEAPFYDVAKNLFPRLLQAGEYMQAICTDTKTYWADVGNPQQYFQSVRDIQSGKLQLETLPLIDPSVEIGAESILTGANQIGKNVKIGQNCEIDNCIIWNDVNIGDNAKLVNCIIGSNGFVNAGAKLKDQILVAANNGAKA